MTIYRMEYMGKNHIGSFYFATRFLAETYGNRAIFAGDITGFIISSVSIITEVE